MDTLTTGQVARLLGTTVPRVHRVIARLGFQPDRSMGGHLRLSPADVDRLIAEIGRVPRLPDLDREEILALAALGRRPFGLASGRAVSRASGISPTAALAALRRLERLGYVEHVRRQVVAGRVKTMWVWQVRWTSSQWRSVASALASAVLPVAKPAEQPQRLPDRFAHLFWDVPHPTKISLRESGPTVAHRMLGSSDPEAISWAVQSLTPSDIRRGAQFRGTDERVRALAENVAR